MTKKRIDWKRIGEFSVDSGTVMLVDPCYITGELHAEIVRDFEALKKEVCNSPDPRASSPIARQCGRLAVVSGTGCSDGAYPVYAHIEDGYVKALFIRFMAEEEA